MEPIKIAGTEDTPTVILDKDKDIMEISGRSLPEDVASFYDPILNWLDEYAQDTNEKTIFNFSVGIDSIVISECFCRSYGL